MERLKAMNVQHAHLADAPLTWNADQADQLTDAELPRRNSIRRRAMTQHGQAGSVAGFPQVAAESTACHL
jgi:hypothetical protein